MGVSAQGEAAQKRKQAQDLLHNSRWTSGSAADLQAGDLLQELRKLREFDLLAQLSERVVRLHPHDPLVRRLQTQALIETGHVTAAIEVAKAGLKGLPDSHPEWSELTGLIGRAYKQIVMDAQGFGDNESIAALRESLKAYAKPHLKDPKNTWHAINLVALSNLAKRMGLNLQGKLNNETLAKQVIATIENKPPGQRDHWDAATLAEANLATGDLSAVERHLNTYLSDTRVKAFDVGSTLRQFRQVWGLEDATDSRRQGILECLRVRLLQLPGGELGLSPKELTLQRTQALPTRAQLEAILGTDGTVSYKWWKEGLDRACSVAAVYAGVDKRIGTSFLVRSLDMKKSDTDELLVLTNFHVVNPLGAGGALRPEDADIAFEAVDPNKRYRIKAIVWSSPVERHDACLLRLVEKPVGIEPLPIAPNLPVIEEGARVYIIGYPAGGGLEFSFQDNALLDHEGPPHGKPANADVCRLRYRTPTEKGSSGSPVFNRNRWEVIALHHAGGILSQLNGKPGTHLANEGIALQSIMGGGKGP